MAFKLKGMSHGEGTGAHTRKPEYRLPDEMSSPVNMGKHPLYMTPTYGSPTDMMDQNASSPNKVAPIAYGLGLAARWALPRVAAWGSRKVMQHASKKAGQKLTTELVKHGSKFSTIPTGRVLPTISKTLKGASNLITNPVGTIWKGAPKWLKTGGNIASWWVGADLAAKGFDKALNLSQPETTYNPDADDPTTKNKKKNRKRNTTKNPNTKTPTTKGTDISKRIKEEYLRKALGLSGTDVDLSKLVGGGGTSKRSKLRGAKKIEHKKDPITGASTTTKTKGKGLYGLEGKKVKSTTTLPGGTTIKKKEKYGRKVTGEGDTGDWWTGRRKKSKTTVKTKGLVVKVKKKRGKTIVKTRKRGGIFSKRTRIS